MAAQSVKFDRAVDYTTMIKNRLWSALWELSDDEMARGLAALEPVIEAYYPNRDKVIVTSTTFYARAYYPPA